MRWEVPRNEDDNDEEDDDDDKECEYESTWIYRAISSSIDFS